MPAQSLVLQRPAFVLQIPFPDISRQLAAEKRWIKAGVADKSQYFTIIDIHGNRRSGLFAESLLGLFLYGGIDRQDDAVTHRGIGLGDGPQDPPAGVNLQLPATVIPVQLHLQSALNPVFADVVTGIVLFVPLGI